MFSRNEKYGQALHLQYGSSNDGADLASLNGYFNASMLWQRILSFRDGNPNQNTVEIDLSNDASRQAAKCDHRINSAIANENEIERMSVKTAFVK